MFIITAKVSKRRLALGAAALAAVLLAVGVAAGLTEYIPTLGASSDAGGDTVTAQAMTSEERIAYLQECGWEVDAASCVVREVIIPSDFDETYQSYADLQARQGFELEKYKGKRVRQVTYEVTNYPDGEEVVAELLIYRGKIIAGDISSMQTDGGFTRGLMDHPEDQTTDENDTESTNAEETGTQDSQ